MAIQSALDNIVVKVKHKYVGNFTSIMKIAAIQNNTSIEPADLVNIVGEVVSVPQSISNKRENNGLRLDDIKPGDVAIFSHLVIFSFESTAPEEEPIFKNRVWYNGEEYFLCNIQHLFAVIRGEEIRMQNGYVMLQEMEKPPVIVLPTHVKKTIRTAQAVVAHIGKPPQNQQEINVKPGDRVFFNPTILQLYQINGNPFGIIRQKDILGRSVPHYSEIATLN